MVLVVVVWRAEGGMWSQETGRRSICILVFWAAGQHLQRARPGRAIHRPQGVTHPQPGRPCCRCSCRMRHSALGQTRPHPCPYPGPANGACDVQETLHEGASENPFPPTTTPHRVGHPPRHPARMIRGCTHHSPNLHSPRCRKPLSQKTGPPGVGVGVGVGVVQARLSVSAAMYMVSSADVPHCPRLAPRRPEARKHVLDAPCPREAFRSGPMVHSAAKACS